MAQTKPLLTVKDLCISIGTPKAPLGQIVHDISFSLRAGEVIGLIGESGAGKSTIGLATLGYFRSGCFMSAGEITFDGVDIHNADDDQLNRLRGQRVTYIAQSAAASFNPAWTIIRQVTEIVVIRGLMKRTDAEAKARQLFRALELPDPDRFGERYPHQVSGGQLQRAMAAMALITDPDMVIFDEPTTALDTTTQFEVLSVFRRVLRERGAAGIYITHDMGVVAQVVDKIMVLRHGRQVETNEADTLLSRPQDPYTRELVATRARHDPPRLDTQQTAPVLVVKAMSARYVAAAPLLEEIDFAIYPGETLALVGESGSGKSTVSRVICGLLPPRSGSLTLKTQALPRKLAARTADQKRRIQLIHQLPDIALNPRHKILDIIARPAQLFFGLSQNEAQSRARALIDRMALPAAVADLYPVNLSGGQKQRVCIARALAAEPDLLVCDEVTSALDPVTAMEMVDLFKGLQADLGMACLFISHQLEIVSSLAHRTAVMQRGRILELAPTAQLFEPPYHPYTHKLLTSAPESRVGWMDEVLAARQSEAEALRASV